MFCSDCFNDDFIRDFIVRKGAIKGACPNCGSLSPQVESKQLAPYLEQLLDAYSIKSEGGKPLAVLWQEDWRIFSERLSDPGALVQAVLAVGPETLFAPRRAEAGISLEHWDELRREIKGVNRFFPDYSLPGEVIFKVFDHLAVDVPVDVFYRGRIVDPGKEHQLDQLGAPPPHLASAGRANPIGIPYLYLATDEITAMCEIKPQKGAEAMVVGFRQVPGRQLRVVDLHEPRAKISPFKWGGAIPDLLSTVPLIEALGHELSIPVQPTSAAIDYLASQYVCELIKKCGFSGVRYGSSLGPGANFAFFDPMMFEAQPPPRRYRVSDVRIDATVM